MADYMANTNRDMEGKRIDLNTASQEELERISDVGPDYARKIIEERNRRGGFARIEDLEDVEGIGPETIKQLHRSARVGQPARG
jgi:competence protein ComEA